jgi:hypothetical protein
VKILIQEKPERRKVRINKEMVEGRKKETKNKYFQISWVCTRQNARTN